MPFNINLGSEGILPPDLGGALIVSGFSVSNEVESRPHQEPFPYDSSLAFYGSGSGPQFNYDDINVASGQFFSENPIITWNLVDPSTENIISSDGSLRTFMRIPERAPSVASVLGRVSLSNTTISSSGFPYSK